MPTAAKTPASVTGAWLASAGVNPANIEAAVSSIFAEFDRLASEPVLESELADSQAYLTGVLPLTLETNEGVAATLANMEWYGLGLDYLIRYHDLIYDITPADVQASPSAIYNLPIACWSSPDPTGKADRATRWRPRPAKSSSCRDTPALRTGVDMIEVRPRGAGRVTAHGDRFLHHVYTPAEIALCQGKSDVVGCALCRQRGRRQGAGHGAVAPRGELDARSRFCATPQPARPTWSCTGLPPRTPSGWA